MRNNQKRVSFSFFLKKKMLERKIQKTKKNNKNENKSKRLEPWVIEENQLDGKENETATACRLSDTVLKQNTRPSSTHPPNYTPPFSGSKYPSQHSYTCASSWNT
jgi:hypothetical protein